MKKVFFTLIILMFVMCLTGCHEDPNDYDKINIDFIIESKSYPIEIEKNTKIYKGLIPINIEGVVRFYYDEEMKNEYNYELIENDIKIYVKKISNVQIENELKKIYCTV